ncbi:DsbA family protein, partial [Pseudomonas syringae group genomosp. 7]|uniref:DsbA family protein n=1 Tax=Pseudomonas syringae group genomosp. 7 TaxID=251699 RepID=UPI0037703BDB
ERRIYNTFHAHRLLHWADQQGRQHATKQALFDASFSDLQDPASHQALADGAQKVGLDGLRAQAILDSGEYTAEVR